MHGCPGSVAFNSPLIIWTELNGLRNSVHKDIKLRQERQTNCLHDSRPFLRSKPLFCAGPPWPDRRSPDGVDTLLRGSSGVNGSCPDSAAVSGRLPQLSGNLLGLPSWPTPPQAFVRQGAFHARASRRDESVKQAATSAVAPSHQARGLEQLARHAIAVANVQGGHLHVRLEVGRRRGPGYPRQ